MRMPTHILWVVKSQNKPFLVVGQPKSARLLLVRLKTYFCVHKHPFTLLTPLFLLLMEQITKCHVDSGSATSENPANEHHHTATISNMHLPIIVPRHPMDANSQHVSEPS